MLRQRLIHSLLILTTLFPIGGYMSKITNPLENDTEISAGGNWIPAPEFAFSEMSVSMNTPTQNTISFEMPVDMNSKESTFREIPHLVLKRNGNLTPGYERTLKLTLHRVPVFSPGVYVELSIITHHNDPDNYTSGSELKIWEDRQFVPYNGLTQQGVRLDFTIVFSSSYDLGFGTRETPTDYFKYQIDIFDLNGNLRKRQTEDFAFLMENQWRVPLPSLSETEPDSAPDHLLVYYYDMVPFQADSQKPNSRIPRSNIDRYIQTMLIPSMVDVVELQSNVWNFPWYPEWRNLRKDADPKTLSVALGEYGVWFHGEAPPLGHSMISIRVDGVVDGYENLTDGLMGIFQHELFHNHQRNIALHYNGEGNVAGMDDAWRMFSEGTAVLATSVSQPDLEFERSSSQRSYFKRANSFIGVDGVVDSSLNRSYKSIPYHTATYWRFLYEQCGGIDNGRENPAAGMSVIRNALETLYSGEVINIYESADSIGNLPAILDRAITNTPSCPFNSYRESLVKFADALYSLRLPEEQCSTPNKPFDCHFHDPNGLYAKPKVERVSVIRYLETSISGKVPSSFGIDFVDIDLDEESARRSVLIVFNTIEGSDADFTIEMIKLKTFSDDGTSQSPTQVGSPIILNADTGSIKIILDHPDLNSFDRIGLIITRTDANESHDNRGQYKIDVTVR